jgi:hypothetical protein
VTTTTAIPSVEGEFAPAEAAASMAEQLDTENRAGNPQIQAKALTVVEGIMAEWSDRMQPLFRRWRATNKLLAGNTLDRGGPEDWHMPELYKALETIVPRMEETVIGLYDPWFRLVPRRAKDQKDVAANSAFVDWQFTQAKVRPTIQPALRDMLISQACAWYCWWDNQEKTQTIRKWKSKIGKDGKLHKSVQKQRKKVIRFSGPRASLVDPFDFIIESRSTDPQTAPYVGHRWWMTEDEIKRIGKQMGWKNLDKISKTQAQTLGPYQDAYKWSSDPTMRMGALSLALNPTAGRPDKLEVCVLYTVCDINDGQPGADSDYRDTRLVVVGGKTVVEVRDNPLDGDLRPYAIARVSKSGHHFYSTGPFDNAIRLSQQLDRYSQVFMRGANLAAQPIGFADDDGDLPDSLYSVRPGKIYKGVGNIRFTEIPSGFLNAAPMVIGMLQRTIEETTGAFRVNMGQDTGGTAHEAQLAFQEGNRRLSGMVRCFGEGLAQLISIFMQLNLQFSTDDVEFAVLGKRALDLRRQHMTISPADLLEDVHVEIVGLRNARNYGLKATGWQAFMQTMTPFLMANSASVDQIGLMHDVAAELVGQEEADARIKVPTPLDQLKPQSEENLVLLAGEIVEVDPDDNDEEHLKDPDFLKLVMRSYSDKEMPEHVRDAIWTHLRHHLDQHNRKMAQDSVRQKRADLQRQVTAPEAGGEPTSPQRGGFSDATKQLGAEPGGQTPGENPGPADSMKYGSAASAGRTTNQSENMAQ